jgi:hypothetical protein
LQFKVKMEMGGNGLGGDGASQIGGCFCILTVRRGRIGWIRPCQKQIEFIRAGVDG